MKRFYHTPQKELKVSYSRTSLFGTTLFIIILAFSAAAEIPRVISYQGLITDNSGNPVADGTYTMRFRLYDAEIGGNLLWDSTGISVSLSSGIFNVLLGESPQPVNNLPFDEDYWLSVTFSGTTMSPRQRLGSVGYAYMASGLVPGTDIVGSVTTGNYAIIYAANTGTAGSAYGISGRSYSTDGRGVYGWASASSGYTSGVLGASSSPNGKGVYGYTTAASGVNHGVYGYSASTEGHGVHGYALNGSGSNYGGYFESESSDGCGAYGFADASSGTTFGLMGKVDSDDGFGVIGLHSGYDESDLGGYYAPGGFFGGRNGVVGVTNHIGGYGVVAASQTTTGSYGVLGRISGTSGIAVHGDATSTTGTTYAVRGINNSTEGFGVYGEASAGSGYTRGVYGKVNSGAGYAVFGEGVGIGVRGTASSSDGTAISGYASSTVGEPRAISGVCEGPDGTAVRGQVYGSADYINYGVMGISTSPSGYGVYYIGGIGGSGMMRNIITTSRGATALDVVTATGNWVEEFGSSQLIEGRADITLDPLYLETVTIDASNPMKVFVQLGGPSNGVYVEKNTTGFSVIELNDGESSIPFDYRIVAKKKGFENHRLDILDTPPDEYHINDQLEGVH